jgi:predicted nucleic acid-binding protein
MLFIYLLKQHPQFGERVRFLRERSFERGDEICTSSLVLGEVLAGVYLKETPADADRVRAGILEAGVKILPFEGTASDTFGRIRATHRTSAADSINLACAAVANVDLFLTGDRQLIKLHVPGIKFIAGLNTDLL